MDNLAKTVLPGFRDAFIILGEVLGSVESALRAINKLLDELLGKEPSGILKEGSPPLLARMFDAIEESVSNADETLRNSLFTQNDFGIGRLTPGALALGPGGGAAVAPVTRTLCSCLMNQWVGS